LGGRGDGSRWVEGARNRSNNGFWQQGKLDMSFM
jgi:hypothetical protein